MAASHHEEQRGAAIFLCRGAVLVKKVSNWKDYLEDGLGVVIRTPFRACEASRRGYFHEEVRGLPVVCAFVSKLVYSAAEERSEKIVFCDSVGSKQILRLDHQINFHRCALYHLNADFMILTFKGTSDFPDMWEDLLIFMGVLTAVGPRRDTQIREALKHMGADSYACFAQFLKARYPNRKLVVTGHSLGGAAAMSFSAIAPNGNDVEKCYAFNPGTGLFQQNDIDLSGIVSMIRNDELFRGAESLCALLRGWERKVICHHIFGDPVSLLTSSSATTQVCTFRPKQANPHAIDNFLPPFLLDLAESMKDGFKLTRDHCFKGEEEEDKLIEEAIRLSLREWKEHVAIDIAINQILQDQCKVLAQEGRDEEQMLQVAICQSEQEAKQEEEGAKAVQMAIDESQHEWARHQSLYQAELDANERNVKAAIVQSHQAWLVSQSLQETKREAEETNLRNAMHQSQLEWAINESWRQETLDAEDRDINIAISWSQQDWDENHKLPKMKDHAADIDLLRAIHESQEDWSQEQDLRDAEQYACDRALNVAIDQSRHGCLESNFSLDIKREAADADLSCAVNCRSRQAERNSQELEFERWLHADCEETGSSTQSVQREDKALEIFADQICLVVAGSTCIALCCHALVYNAIARCASSA